MNGPLMEFATRSRNRLVERCDSAVLREGYGGVWIVERSGPDGPVVKCETPDLAVARLAFDAEVEKIKDNATKEKTENGQ